MPATATLARAAYPLRPPGATQITFMYASVVRSATVLPAADTARCSSAAVQIPWASSPAASATANAWASARPPGSGSSAAVAGSWPS